MEAKLNIANILKDKQKGTKLYADAFGELKLERVKVNEVDAIYTKNKTSTLYCFYNDGRYNKNGEPILVPSKEMRDWHKFDWKKGDILVSNDNDSHIIFKGFSKDDYTTFEGKYWISVSKKRYVSHLYMQETQNYHIEDRDAAQTYINTIEERFGGKLNLETLEIEKQPKFKDGDILYVKTKLGSEYIMINKLSEEVKTACYIDCNLSSKKIFWNRIHSVCCDEEIDILRQATDYEKSQLFEALTKKNKAWDSEKKAIVYLKQKWKLKWTPKPFDRVITRNDDDDIWTANIFSHMDSYGEYVTIGCVGGYPYCIPYNEETAKLIGTTKEWKE